jgi:hypothetical protein
VLRNGTMDSVLSSLNNVLTQSQIEETLDPFTTVVKLDLPLGGLSVACPNCGATSVYQRHELIYRKL